MTRARGTSITTDQIRGAPLGAVFVWCNNRLWYAKDLAGHLGRRDLVIATPESWYAHWRGTRKMVVFDHALDPTTLVKHELDDYSRFSEKALCTSA